MDTSEQSISRRRPAETAHKALETLLELSERMLGDLRYQSKLEGVRSSMDRFMIDDHDCVATTPKVDPVKNDD